MSSRGLAPSSRIQSRAAIMIVVLVTSVFPVNLVPSASRDQAGIDGQLSGKQGEVLSVEVPVAGHPAHVNGQFLNRIVWFYPGADGHYVGLLGIDMQDDVGMYELVVEATYADRTDRMSYSVLVMKQEYPVEHLTLPDRMVTLSEDTLIRVKNEKTQVREAFKVVAPTRYWAGAFVEPVRGRVTGAFGNRRIINGHPRSPHSGEDIAAPLGTTVLAMNHGMVRLTVDHFFSGKGVIIDHGLGLYSMYFHLSEFLVEEGQAVKKGQPIGRVGATGRATGPHLHWGMRLNGSRVNPYSLVHLSINGITSSTHE